MEISSRAKDTAERVPPGIPGQTGPDRTLQAADRAWRTADRAWRTADRAWRTARRAPLWAKARRTGLLVGIVTALFAVRCSGSQSNGSAHPSTSDPSCSPNNTVGELGQVRFFFEENPWVDLSADGPSAFATGTSIRFRVQPNEDDDPLPLLHATSSDASVLQAETNSPADAPYPHTLQFKAAGTAGVDLLTNSGRDLVDRLTLRVADPAGMELTAGPLGAEPVYADDFAAQPTRIWLAPEGGARIVFLLRSASGVDLVGNWTPELENGQSFLAVDEGRISMGEQVWISAHTVSVLGLGSETTSSEERLTIRGPLGVEATVAIRLDATPVIVDLSLVPSFWVDLGKDSSEDPLIDPAADGRVEVGTSGTLAAIGYTGSGEPAIGYPVRFITSDPRVATVSPSSGSPDSALVRFESQGEVTITAVLDQDPFIQIQLRLLVTRNLG